VRVSLSPPTDLFVDSAERSIIVELGAFSVDLRISIPFGILPRHLIGKEEEIVQDKQRVIFWLGERRSYLIESSLPGSSARLNE
jgi:hypothetical protein